MNDRCKNERANIGGDEIENDSQIGDIDQVFV
jgi:hypothetical protein